MTNQIYATKLSMSQVFLEGKRIPVTFFKLSSNITDEKPNLQPGLIINVTGTSKGKGFTGTIKRWGFSAQPRTHGQSDRRRAPGSIGRGTTPGRVLPGKKMAGRHGNRSIHIRNLKIVSFNPESKELCISGSVPGTRNSLVKITITSKK